MYSIYYYKTKDNYMTAATTRLSSDDGFCYLEVVLNSLCENTWCIDIHDESVITPGNKILVTENLIG